MIPKYIALCGAPKSGKTTVAGWLEERYGAVVIDDGLMLRKGVAELFAGFGVLPNDPFTQEGKFKSVLVCGKTYEVRRLLGQVGNLLEDHFGQQIMPEAALHCTNSLSPTYAGDASFYVFPSCRKTQGLSYRNVGGLVIEIIRPGYESVNDFDHYDKSLLTHSLYNDEDEAAFKAKVFRFFDKLAEG